jgi:hypothetical protein
LMAGGGEPHTHHPYSFTSSSRLDRPARGVAYPAF